jgi:glycosyltransferase involved in cell wall biosynthesis
MVGVVSFPPVLKENAYQRLLYESLAPEGFSILDGGELKVWWLALNRRRARVLHFHWPMPYYRLARRPQALKSRIKFMLFALRLAAARVLGYRIAWTIHEVFPLDTNAKELDRRGARLLARFANVLLANDQQTADAAREELGRVASDVHVVPHSSYVGAYEEGRSRAEVRAELGIAEDAFVFLLFGHISVYKQVPWFVERFREAGAENAVLLVAGLVMDEADGEAIRTAAAQDRRVKALLEFIADDRVAELYGASDAAICPRQDGGTSGALMLAFSMGMAPLAARHPTYETLTDGETAAWLFTPHDDASLEAALRAAAGDPDANRAKGEAGRRLVDDFTWDGMGARIGALLRGT